MKITQIVLGERGNVIGLADNNLVYMFERYGGTWEPYWDEKREGD